MNLLLLTEPSYAVVLSTEPGSFTFLVSLSAPGGGGVPVSFCPVAWAMLASLFLALHALVLFAVWSL
jgi:hypothetical protein